MNERIRELAKQAGVWEYYEIKEGVGEDERELEKFAELVRADEREACAKVCENMERSAIWITKAEAAAAIRARGEK